MKLYKAPHSLLLLISLLLASCLPEQSAVRDLSSTDSNSTGTDTDDDGITNDDITSGISELNYFQQGATSTSSTLSMYSDFTDSFLMRGDNIHNFLKDHVVGTQKVLCMAVSFPFSLDKKVYVMGARARNYYNSKLGGKEYYLQMEVANETNNVNDCLNVNLTTAIANQFGASSLAFKIADVCPSCQTNITSSSIKLFLSSGTITDQVQFNNLAINIIAKQNGSGSTGGQTCQADSVCKVEGYDCCLQNQCVNHGEVKPSVDTTSTSYTYALEQILARPSLITNFTEYFYVCPNEVPTDPTDSGDDTSTTDPDQQADDLFTELQDAYNCLNPVIDEFSICSAEVDIDLDNIGGGGTSVSAGVDDLTFSGINSDLTFNNIVRIDYAGTTIFKEQVLSDDSTVALDSSTTTISGANDDLSSAQTVTVDKAIPADATSDSLKAYYRIDGTCERLGTSLAKCQKYYVQGQVSTPPRSSDHAGGNSFKLPSYANFAYNIIVEVGGVSIPTGTDTWSGNSSTKEIQFVNTIYNNQDVKITYFVTSGVNELMASKEAAEAVVDTHCKCDPDNTCNLKPVYETVDDEEKLVNYVCEYGQPDVPDAPLQKTVYISSKTAPHRYYDQSGVHYELNDIGDAQDQEGTEFRYESDNTLKPNNQDQYIGFNEIYGSFSREEISAMPATVVDIKKGTQYDLFVDSGSFSSCLSCGTDYFSNLQKLFPANFTNMGGGYLPDMVESRRKANQGSFSSEDMRFGRACFVPATMIPWTHRADTNVTQQRRNRLAAQHFMFANGYNKDWYGFDYGSLIGSFDGVRWFSVGNQRRIQAKSNKLYLAINGYFGDLTIDNSFKVVVSELSSIINSGSAITHDTDSDGAQCQKAHYCSTDNDCIAQLGYDYTCQSVSGLYTPWPTFDNNGNEISGSTSLSLLSIVGGSNGQVKRCVYRGAGSLCEKELASVSASSSYASSDSAAIHACSPNTYCAALTESKFNDRIARYGQSPAVQNNQSFITTEIGTGDTFGLAARIIGRPFDFYGTKAAPSGVASHLQNLNANAMCVPGKNPMASLNVAGLNKLSGTRSADKALGIGKTFPEYISQSPGYFAACPATDDDEIFTHTDPDRFAESLTTQDPETHAVFASAQNMSTNSLTLPAFSGLDLFSDDSTTMTRVGYNKASCLRAPGSSCFSDYDCSPNTFISQKIKTLTNLSGILSQAEHNFWKEELVCANSQDRYLASSIYPNPVYELNEHRCCRETGKDFTFATQMHLESDFKVVDGDNPAGDILLPGVNQNINSSERYSRTHTIYDKLINERTKYPPLYSPGKERTEAVDYVYNQLRQYNTLHLNNSRMCCTGHWVRNFASGTNGNGGGHKFNGQTQQRIDKAIFKTLNWEDNNDPAINEFENYEPLPYTCQAVDWQTSDCEIKNITAGGSEETKWLDWFGSLELLGIPQVLVETNKDFYVKLDEMQEEIPGASPDYRKPLEGTIKDNWDDGIADAVYNSEKYYSAASYDNFEVGSGKLKKVFSEDSFSCCVPTGIEVDGSMENSKCCSGQVNTETVDGAQVSRCCLNDFTDVSVFTNRYVSSEGAYINGQEISENDIDEKTGYIRKEVVLQMAPTMCCSGVAAYGVALGDYFIPMDDGGVIQSAKSRRWLYLEDLDNADEVGGGVTKYNAGMKWNNHVYCVPAELAGSNGSGSTGSGGSGATQN